MTDDERKRIEDDATWRANVDNHMKRADDRWKLVLIIILSLGGMVGTSIYANLSEVVFK